VCIAQRQLDILGSAQVLKQPLLLRLPPLPRPLQLALLL
jgi:hypothetical protein